MAGRARNGWLSLTAPGLNIQKLLDSDHFARSPCPGQAAVPESPTLEGVAWPVTLGAEQTPWNAQAFECPKHFAAAQAFIDKVAADMQADIPWQEPLDKAR